MIDIPTFMLVLAIGNIAFAALMAGYARGGNDNPALRIWTWSKLVQACAHLLGWMRPDYPGLPLVLTANSTLVLGMTLEVAAYCSFFCIRRWQRLLYPAAALALLAYHGASLGGATAGTLTVLMSLISAALAGSMAYVLLRGRPRPSALRKIIGLNDLLFFGATGARALFTPTFTQPFVYLAGYLLMIVNGFGFLLLCKERDDAALQELATRDSLTGLVNRRAFFERTDSARALAARMQTPVTLMMLDIDHFKRINDRHGHAAGDRALIVFAESALSVLREHDILARMGGEEFALLLPGTGLAGAVQAAERLRGAVGAAPGLPMTVSIGVVELDADEDINAALARADHALYEAKRAGRNRVETGLAQRRCA